jgi:V/A-type H+-transporting ATPase subunit A
MLKTIVMFQENATAALDRGVASEDVIGLSVKEDIGKMKYIPETEFADEVKAIQDKVIKQTSEV